MRPARWRTLAVDLPVAGAVGLISWGAAQISRMPDHIEGGPWRHGPPGRPDIELPGIPWAVLGSVLVLIGGLAGRRIWPRLSYLIVVAAVAGYLAAGGPYGPVLLAPALALHALATALPVGRWIPLTLLLVPMLMAGYWDQPYLGLLDPTMYGALVIGFSVMVLPAMVGVLRRARRESERVEHDQELRQYAYEERLRIAREVHDVVGHSLSVINLQAGVALHVLDKRPDQVETALEAIKRTSREALAELRTTLAVFRDPAAEEPLAPGAGLDRLDDLVGALRAAGREVIVSCADANGGPMLPAAVDQAAYRIIQEALTNVVRHAGTAAATVTISRPPGAVVLEVSDDGAGLISPGSRPAQPIAEGNGILGMRERARAVGGTLLLGPGPGGGFRVVATLPVPSGGDPE